MITAQDIREKTFEKSKFGGYAMNEVDDFLDEIANDLAALQKEYSVLRGKMKVLVGKIEEYRNSEDAMRMALISAQKVAKDIESDSQSLASSMIAEAETKASSIIAQAQAQADLICGGLEERRAQEELRLQKAQTSAAEFIQTMMALTEKERALLATLKDMDFSSAVSKAAPAQAAPAQAAPRTTVRAAAPVQTAPAEVTPPEITPAEDVLEEIPGDEPDYFKAFEDAVYQPAAEAEESDGSDFLDFKL